MTTLVYLFAFLAVPGTNVIAFTPFYGKSINIRNNIRRTPYLDAKRRKTEGSDNSWYEEIDENATPEDVFWSEMERQKAQSGVMPDTTPDDPFRAIAATQVTTATPKDSTGPTTPGPLEERATEKALANYAEFMVDDNWLNEEYAKMLSIQDIDLDEQNADLERQFADWEKENEENQEDQDNFSLASRITEPWDSWSDGQDSASGNDEDDSSVKRNMEKGECVHLAPKLIIIDINIHC